MILPGWHFVDHCCRSCIGRIVKSGAVYRCSTCASEAARASTLCACGITVAGLKEVRPGPRLGHKAGPKVLVTVTPPRLAGFRCGRNPRRTARCPAEIIVFLDGRPFVPGDGT